MKKWDIYIICFLFAIGGMLLVVTQLNGNSGQLRVNIYVAGFLEYDEPLPATDKYITIAGVGGSNTVLLQKDGVCITEADCLSLDCVHKGKITVPNMTVTCLPHRVLVVLKSASHTQNGEIDIVAG